MKSKLGFLVDVSVGVGLGIIFARQPGKKTREAIRRTAEGAFDEAASTGARIASRVKDAAVKGKKEVATAFEAGKEAYETARA